MSCLPVETSCLLAENILNQTPESMQVFIIYKGGRRQIKETQFHRRIHFESKLSLQPLS